MHNYILTKQQLRNLIEFSQRFYECLPKDGDMQLQLIATLNLTMDVVEGNGYLDIVADNINLDRSNEE